MAIQFRSTPKRAQRDTSVDAILSRQDFGDAVAAVNMTLADIAKQTGVNRQYLSEFKSGDRNLRAEHRQKLRNFFEAMGVEFVAADDLDLEDGWPDFEPSTRPTQSAAANAAVLPVPTFATVVGAQLPDAEREAVMRELDSVVRENDLRLSTAIGYSFAFPSDLTGESKSVSKKLHEGLANEAILRRVLAGTFKARNAKSKATNHAYLIAQQLLHGLPEAGSATGPNPLADSSDENSVADAASAGAARGEGPSAREPSATLTD